jgi:hypothetical protein
VPCKPKISLARIPRRSRNGLGTRPAGKRACPQGRRVSASCRRFCRILGGRPAPFTSRGRVRDAAQALSAADGGWIREPGDPTPPISPRHKLLLLICRLSRTTTGTPHPPRAALPARLPASYGTSLFPARAVPPPRRTNPFWLARSERPTISTRAISLSGQQEASSAGRLAGSGLALSSPPGDAANRYRSAPRAGSAPFGHATRRRSSGGRVDAICLGDGVAWLRNSCGDGLGRSDRPPRRVSPLWAAIAGTSPAFYAIATPAAWSPSTAASRLPFPTRHRQTRWTSGEG